MEKVLGKKVIFLLNINKHIILSILVANLPRALVKTCAVFR
jgi:hypothetical protein